MLDRNTIKKQLSEVSPGFLVAFAVRAAIRALPILADKAKADKPFWFWKENEARHIFTILHALRLSVTVSSIYTVTSYKHKPVYPYASAYGCLFDDIVAPDAASTASAFDNYVAITSAAHGAVYGSGRYLLATFDHYNPHYFASDDHTSYVAAFHAAAVFFSACAFAVGTTAHGIAFKELNLITPINFFADKGRGFVPVFDYLTQPLWQGKPPENWSANWNDFKQAVLSVGAGFSGFLDWFDDRIAGKPIDLLLLGKQTLIPEEILAQDVDSINAYLNSLTDAGKALNRVRAIFMGYGTAGKTSLVRCLLGEDVVEGKEDMTPGIDIREWPVPDSPLRAHMWDFGGQVVAHATHQFFLRTDCLYVLVMDARAEINATEQAQYWLEHVKAFAGSAPVMLVGNKADLVRINPDLETLQERYPNIVGFYNLSCTQYKTVYKPDFDSFKRDFIRQLAQMELHQVRFLDKHFNAMRILRAQSRKQAFLTETDFRRFCEQAGVQQDGGLNQEWLLDILDKLGVIIHFPDLPFHDAYVLNPRWLTYGVYALLYSQAAKESQGRLTRQQVVTILQQEEIHDEQGHVLFYPREKCSFIVEAMRSFKLCYFLNDNASTLVIPDLLPSNRPELHFDKAQPGIVFEFRFLHLLPRHVMPMFIVSRHHEIENDQVWQTGVVLKNDTHVARALVTANYSDRVISLHVQGIDAKDYLHILHDELTQIIDKLKDLPFDELVELPEEALYREGGLLRMYPKEKALYRQLLGTLRANHKTFISTLGYKYNLFKVLGYIMTNEKLEKATNGGCTINGNGNVVINNVQNSAVGNIGDVNISQLSSNLDNVLRQLIDVIQIKVDASEDKEKALRELAIIRGQVAPAVNGGQNEKRDAKNRLLEFAESLKNGVNYVAKVSSDAAAIKDKLPGVLIAITALVDKLLS